MGGTASSIETNMCPSWRLAAVISTLRACLTGVCRAVTVESGRQEKRWPDGVAGRQEKRRSNGVARRQEGNGLAAPRDNLRVIKRIIATRTIASVVLGNRS